MVWGVSRWSGCRGILLVSESSAILSDLLSAILLRQHHTSADKGRGKVNLDHTMNVGSCAPERRPPGAPPDRSTQSHHLSCLAAMHDPQKVDSDESTTSRSNKLKALCQTSLSPCLLQLYKSNLHTLSKAMAPSEAVQCHGGRLCTTPSPSARDWRMVRQPKATMILHDPMSALHATVVVGLLHGLSSKPQVAIDWGILCRGPNFGLW